MCFATGCGEVMPDATCCSYLGTKDAPALFMSSLKNMAKLFVLRLVRVPVPTVHSDHSVVPP